MKHGKKRSIHVLCDRERNDPFFVQLGIILIDEEVALEKGRA